MNLKTSTASGTSMRLDCVKDILDIPGLMDIPDWDWRSFQSCETDIHFRAFPLSNDDDYDVGDDSRPQLFSADSESLFFMI